MPSSDSGQLLLVGVPGPELDAETAAFFGKLQPGGYIFLAATSVRRPSFEN